MQTVKIVVLLRTGNQVLENRVPIFGQSKPFQKRPIRKCGVGKECRQQNACDDELPHIYAPYSDTTTEWSEFTNGYRMSDFRIRAPPCRNRLSAHEKSAVRRKRPDDTVITHRHYSRPGESVPSDQPLLSKALPRAEWVNKTGTIAHESRNCASHRNREVSAQPCGTRGSGVGATAYQFFKLSSLKGNCLRTRKQSVALGSVASVRLTKTVAQDGLADQRLQSEILSRSLVDNRVDRQRIQRIELSGECESQQM